MAHEDPVKHLPEDHPLRAGTHVPTTLTCAGCGTEHTFQADHDFQSLIKTTGWAWTLEGSQDSYQCPDCVPRA